MKFVVRMYVNNRLVSSRKFRSIPAANRWIANKVVIGTELVLARL